MKNTVIVTVLGIVVMDVACAAIGEKCSILGQACDCSGGQTGILEGLADGKCHTWNSVCMTGIIVLFQCI